MPINLPVGSAVIIGEYVCDKCENEFYMPQGSGDKMKCPYEWCPGTAHLNGEVKVYVKRQIGNEEISPKADIVVDPQYSKCKPRYSLLFWAKENKYTQDIEEGGRHGQGEYCCDYCICISMERKTFWCRTNLLCGCHTGKWKE
jgi:hypothetical protein